MYHIGILTETDGGSFSQSCTFVFAPADERRDDLERHGDGRGRPTTRQSERGSRGTNTNKRKHSSSHDDCVTPLHGNDAGVSPHNALSFLYQTSVGDDSYLDESKYGLSDKNKLDAKNSRRKMERPRKRKKEEEEEEEGGEAEGPEVDTRASPTIETLLNGANGDDDAAEMGDLGGDTTQQPPTVTTETTGSSSSNNTDSTTTSGLGSPTSALKSPTTATTTTTTTTTAAEDLTVKNGGHASEGATTPASAPRTPGIVQSPAPPTYAAQNGTASQAAVEKWATPPATSSDAFGEIPTSSSSVRDLEEVMNKHLPALPGDADALRSGLHSDFSAASLQGFGKHKSTIQWIGSQHAAGHNAAASAVASATDTLPATHLLRTLYANRESVIRTNVYNPRPQYYGDHSHHHHMQTSLLTPPGSTTDPYKDMSPFTSASTPQVAPAAKTPPTTYSLMSAGYSSNPISVAMGTNMATADSYGMTPPSSVSPQEKYSSPFDQCHPDSASQLRQYATATTPLDGATHAMPIKPQAYPLPAHANAHMAAAYDRSSQYAASSYYAPSAASFSSYNHTGSPSPAHYRDSGKNSVGW